MKPITPTIQSSIAVPNTIKAEESGQTFKEIMNSLQREASNSSQIKEFRELDAKLQRGGAISPRELISYQIKISEFGLRVELVSKLAESLSSTVRRLQSGQ